MSTPANRSGAPPVAAANANTPPASELFGGERDAGEQDTDRKLIEAEEALRLLRERFEAVEDPQVQGELAAEALDHVERQLDLTRQRRRHLDGAEAKLWSRRNQLERFLIETKGAAWWQARRHPQQPQTPGQPT